MQGKMVFLWVVLALIIGGIIGWFSKPASVCDNSQASTTKPAEQTVAPDAANPYKKVQDAANPFKADYQNPFGQ